MVGAGGWDTHISQEAWLSRFFEQVSASLVAFQNALKMLGVQDKVVTATVSDFGRTFRVNPKGGTDHGWGNHMIVVGEPVLGGGLFGRYPQLQLGGPDDIGSEGRWVPTASSDQYFATLASWFGVPDAQLPAIVPNITSFQARNLGFLGAA